MDFPITELMDREACLQWLEEYFHQRVEMPHCQTSLTGKLVSKTEKSDLDVYRCKVCRGIYNLTAERCLKADILRQTNVYYSRSAARQIFSEIGTRVEDQPHNSDGSRHLLQATQSERTKTPLSDLEVETTKCSRTRKGEWRYFSTNGCSCWFRNSSQ